MAEQAGRTRSVLAERRVALLLTSGVVSATGTGAMFVALPFHTYASTGSLRATALVTLAEYAPAVGVAQLAGVVVDRLDARRVLVVADLALALGTLAFLVHDAWWWWAVVALLRSGVGQLVPPATFTLLPAVSPPGRLGEVNGLGAVGSNVARLAGPALGGVLVGVGGLAFVVVLDAATFVAAALLVTGVGLLRPPSRTAGPGPVRAWLQGWSAVRRHAVLRPLVVVMAVLGLGEGFVSALLAPWMTDVAGGGSTALGLMLSVQALGGIVGGVLAVRWSGRLPELTLLGRAATVAGVLLVLTFGYPLLAPVGPWPAVVLTAVAGLPFAVLATAAALAVQSHSTEGLRGRVVSATYGVQGVAQLLGIGLAAPAASVVGPLAVAVDAAAYLLAGALALTTARRLRTRAPDAGRTSSG